MVVALAIVYMVVVVVVEIIIILQVVGMVLVHTPRRK